MKRHSYDGYVCFFACAEDYPGGVEGLRNAIINMRGIFGPGWISIKWRQALYKTYLKRKYSI